MDLHRIVVYVLDFERYGIEDFKIAIENSVDWASFGDSKTAEIGEWDDEHDMNTGKREAESYFMDPNKPFDSVAALAELSEWNFKRQARIEELETQLADARKDGERLSEAEKGQYSIRYNVMNERWEINTCELHPAHRRYVAMKTLRAAIDAARAAEGGKG